MAVRSLFPIILTRDLPTLVAFYERALGGVVDYRFAGDDGADDYVSLSLDGATLGIGRASETPDARDGVALWFYVDDVDAAFAAWIVCGGRAVHEPADMPWGERVAQVRDPAGNLANLGAESS